MDKTTHDPARQRFTSRANFSALSFPNHRNNIYDDNPDEYEDDDYDDTYTDINAPPLPSTPDTLNIMSINTSSQASIAATFRGYCFVFLENAQNKIAPMTTLRQHKSVVLCLSLI